jgi:uncharacterized membrane protein YqiK
VGVARHKSYVPPGSQLNWLVHSAARTLSQRGWHADCFLFELEPLERRRSQVKLILSCALTALLLPMTGRAEDSKAALHDALDAQARAPSEPPVLPDKASARAKFVQQNVAHGENGEKERAEHTHTGEAAAASHADHAADTARSEAANRSAQAAAASAAQSADADSHAAAGQARATQARNGNVPGSGGPAGHPPGHGRDQQMIK